PPGTKPAATPGGIYLFEPVIASDQATRSIELILEKVPDARRVHQRDFVETLDECLEKDGILLIPMVSQFPIEYLDELHAFAEKGGALILIGRRPFEDRVYFKEHHPVTHDKMKDQLIRGAHAVEGISEIETWRHENNLGSIGGTVQRVKGSVWTWPGVMVSVDQLDVWNYLRLTDAPREAIAEDNAMVFQAYSRNLSNRLVVEIEEVDGSTWIHVIRLEDDWKPFLLHQADFQYAEGGVDRGFKQDHLVMSRLKQISIGLDMHWAPQRSGRHEFGLSEIRFARDPRDDAFMRAHLNAFPASNPEARYESSVRNIEELATKKPFETGGVTVEGPLPGPRGAGGAASAPFRWVPLYRGFEEGEERQTWPCSIYIARTGKTGVSRWGWVGLDESRITRKMMQIMIQSCIEALRKPAWLLNAGSPAFTIRSGEMLNATTECLVRDGTGDLRVTAKLGRKDGMNLRTSVSPNIYDQPDDGPLTVIPLEVGVMDYQPGSKNEFLLNISIEDRGRNQIIDQIQQNIKVLPQIGRPRPEKKDPMTIRGSQLVIRNQPQFLLGLNYHPLYMPAEDSEGKALHWLSPGLFDGETVRRDLERLHLLGLNTLIIDYSDLNQAPQLA
ncbi:MAG: hypothetical protein AAF492_15285, partial [Verrucomicrobiota bacterium]